MTCKEIQGLAFSLPQTNSTLLVFKSGNHLHDRRYAVVHEGLLDLGIEYLTAQEIREKYKTKIPKHFSYEVVYKVFYKTYEKVIS